MKHSILHSAIATAMAIGLAACSSGSDVAGIGGSGITSTGTITGFGSIYVNDVKFETSSSTFDVDDNPDSTENVLDLGMRVTVKGTLNADGVTGIANSVAYDDELEGPVSNVKNDGPDKKTITVLGVTVALNRDTTYFNIEHDEDSAVSGTLNFDDISQADTVNKMVEISGYVNSTGELVATRVELEDDTFNLNDTTVEIKGTITSVDATGFTLNILGTTGVIVDVDTSLPPEYEDLPVAGIAEDEVVEVEGKCPVDIDCAMINATRIEGESEGFDDDHDGDVEIEGFITRYDSDSDFDVNGLPVDASTADFNFTLEKDLFVEVEGTVIDNVLIATKVELED